MSIRSIDYPEVIFSLTNGFVWASWPGTEACVRLGNYEAVTAMMRDYLAQAETANRLSDRAAQG